MNFAAYRVRGLVCEACMADVMEKVRAVPGVSYVAVDLVAGGVSRLTVSSSVHVGTDTVRDAIRRSGFDFATGWPWLRRFTARPVPDVAQVPAMDPVVEVGRDEEEMEEDMSQKVTDPVCGMSIDTTSAVGSAEYQGKTYRFCSSHCAESFKADPARYAGTVAQ